MQAKMRAEAVVLNPIPASQAPTGSLFFDSANADLPTAKQTNGTPQQFDAGSSITNTLIKVMISAEAIAAGKPVAKQADGKVINYDSNAVGKQKCIGVSSTSTASDGEEITVVMFGPNISGVLTGLGFTSGDEIFVSSTGYTNDPSAFDSSSDSIIRVGIADCGAVVASAIATDLIVFPAVLSRPTA